MSGGPSARPSSVPPSVRTRHGKERSAGSSSGWLRPCFLPRYFWPISTGCFSVYRRVLLTAAGIAGDLTESIAQTGNGGQGFRTLSGRTRRDSRSHRFAPFCRTCPLLPPVPGTMMRRISLLGSTGSIGVNVLEVVRQFPERFADGRDWRRAAISPLLCQTGP